MSKLTESFVQLKSINLVSVHLNMKIGNSIPKGDAFDFDLGIEYKEINETAYYSIVDISITSPSESSFKLDVKMAGKFEISEGLNIPIDEFFHINAPAIVYPYIRQYVRATTLEAALDPIILPIVNFVSLYDLKQKDKNS